METVGLTEGRAISSTTDAAERSTRWLWQKEKACGQQLLGCKRRPTGTYSLAWTLFLSNPYFDWLFSSIPRLIGAILPLQKDSATPAMVASMHFQIVTHTHTNTAEHNSWPGLMNGPRLNYFVKISFRTLKKRSSLFIHFTFAPRLQYLRLCLQRIYPSLIQEEKTREREGERKAIYTMYIK